MADGTVSSGFSPTMAPPPEGGKHQSPPITQSIENAPPAPTQDRACSSPLKTPMTFDARFNYKRGLPYIVFVGVLVVMYPTLIQLLQLKFQNKHSPFDTHPFLCYTSVVAFAIAILISIILFYGESSKESLTKKYLSPTFNMILKSVFIFFAILGPLSLVMVLLIPRGFNWIGYLIVSLLFLVVSACVVIQYKKLPAASWPSFDCCP